jgi:hydroxymethylpyrimidine pyrophosphatase-like HAD family hydrolase
LPNRHLKASKNDKLEKKCLKNFCLAGIVIIKYKSSTRLQGYSVGNYNGDFKIISTSSSISSTNSSTIFTDTDFMRITRDGASIYNPTGSPLWSTVSDKRIKENIERASYDKCYDNINKLELYRFNYIKELHNINKDNKQLGYIAQEVEDIFPKAISTQQFYNNSLSISDLLSIDISQINYTLYGSVKKLIDMYNDIEKRVDALEKILNIENDLHIVLPDISSTHNLNINSANISTSNNISFYTPSETNIMMNTLTTSNIIDAFTTNTMSIYTSNNIIYDISISNNISFYTPIETNIIIDIT